MNDIGLGYDPLDHSSLPPQHNVEEVATKRVNKEIELLGQYVETYGIKWLEIHGFFSYRLVLPHTPDEVISISRVLTDRYNWPMVVYNTERHTLMLYREYSRGIHRTAVFCQNEQSGFTGNWGTGNIVTVNQKYIKGKFE